LFTCLNYWDHFRFSRYVIAWELSTTLDSDFCVRCLERALETGRPEIFNTDQGVQYTSADFTRTLLSADVQISMTGAGRCFDNIMVERLWRSVKQEEVYLKEYEDVLDCRGNLGEYFEYYDFRRRHSQLDARPAEIYFAANGSSGSRKMILSRRTGAPPRTPGFFKA